MAIVAMPAIRRHDYDEMRGRLAALPPTFDGWVTYQLAQIHEAQAGGDLPQFSSIEPALFAQYLLERSEEASLPRLYEYAAHRMQGAI